MLLALSAASSALDALKSLTSSKSSSSQSTGSKNSTNPFGFSDATFLLNALVDRAGIVSFHGPMVAMDFARGLSPRSLEHMNRLLNGELRNFELEARDVVHPGTAQGERRKV